MQVLEEMRKDLRFDDLPVVIFTARNKADTVHQLIKLGAWDYILKLFDLRTFGRRVSDLVLQLDLTKMQKLLGNLRVQEPSLFRAPVIKEFKGVGFDAYPTVESDRSLCVLVPEGVTPISLTRLPEEELRNSVMVFRKCAYGWRKIWPLKLT